MPSSPPSRYLDLIAASLRIALAQRQPPGSHDPGDLSAECALPAIADRLGFPMSEPTRSALIAQLAVTHGSPRFVDGSGHTRPTYDAIIVRALGQSEIAEAKMICRAYAGRWASAIAALADGDGPLDARNGQSIIGATFAAWAVASLEPSNVAFRALGRVAEAQRPDGTLLARASSDAPEPLWYDELALLHALSTHAAEHNDAVITAAVRRSVRYHAAEVQPDHASSQPWAIAAFLAEPDGVPLADMMLHAAGVQSPATMDAISLLLLADAIA